MGWLFRLLDRTARPWPLAGLVAALVLFRFGMQDTLRRLQDVSGETILDYQVFYSRDRILEILHRYGLEGMDLYRRFMTFDLVFPLLYGFLFASLLHLVLRGTRWRWLALMPLAMAAFDYVENAFFHGFVQAFRAFLEADPDISTPSVVAANILTLAKFGFGGLTAIAALVAIVVLIRGRAKAAPTGPALRRVESWMKIFNVDVPAKTVATEAELADIVRAGDYYCVGSAHSYNGVQIVGDATAVIMNESKLLDMIYCPSTQEVTVGPSVTIRQLKEFLLIHKRRLANSGNFMAQTVVGGLMTGTHGYGDRAVMAEGVTQLIFLDGAGQRVTLKKGDAAFPYAALSFGLIAPVVSLTLATEPTACFEANTIICRLDQKDRLVQPGHATMFAVFPYSDIDNPTIALQTTGPALPPGTTKTSVKQASPLFSLRRISEFIIKRYWAFDRLFPALRRPFQRLISKLNLSYSHRYITDPNDLDYLYDPAPGLESSRSPDVLKSLLSPTYTAYNLAFFVPLEIAPNVVAFVMKQAERLRPLGFYFKSMIGVRELSSKSDLPFAGNYNGPVAAIDLFADVRDYAWLERIQRDVFSAFPGVRPHWGKSAIVDEFIDTLGAKELAALKALHQQHYPDERLRQTNRVRRLVGLKIKPPPPPAAVAAAAPAVAKARKAAVRATTPAGAPAPAATRRRAKPNY